MRSVFRILPSVLLLLMAARPLTAQDTSPGRIQGKVTDAKSGEGLPGANVSIKGTYYGGSSDIDGNITIEKVNSGVYTLEVSLLGYKVIQFTEFKVEAGKTATFRAKLEETVLALGQEIVVVGEKPLFNIEETQSRRDIGQADIHAAALQNVQEIVSLQPGVVLADNEIHIRGGRTHENAYLVDGVSVQDPLAGTGFGLQLSPAAIQEVEVITGGYNAEYGQATSGIVNITTREGADVYSGAFSYTTDHYGLNNSSLANWNTDIYNVNLNGPEPLTTYVLPQLGLKIPGKLTFFGTFYANLSDAYSRWVQIVGPDNRPIGYEAIAPHGLVSSIWGQGHSQPRRDNNYSWMGKLTYKPTSTVKLSYTYNQSVVIDQNTQTVQATLQFVEPNPGYQYQFQFIPDSANTFTQVNIQHSLILTQTLSPETFYELRLSLYSAHVRGDANGRDFSTYIPPQDIISYPIRYYNLGRDTVGVIPGDGFYDLGSPDTWRDHFAQEATLKFDLTTFFTEKNKFKAGIEMRYQQMQMADLFEPWIRPLGYDNDIYSVYPAQGAIYAQDNVTLSGMILNFGLRFDYWAPGKYVDDVAKSQSTDLIISPELRKEYLDDTFPFLGRRVKARLSPRLGISHPVSDNQTLFLSYGHFSKFPSPQFVYPKLTRTSIRSNLPVGNPNLNPETTVSYELGLRNQFSTNDVLTVTAFYKDIFDYITQKTVQRVTGIGGAQYYSTYLNSDYGRSRGIELEYKKRFGEFFRGSLSGSYSIATGKSSTPNQEAIRLQQGEPESIKENYLIWDRPVQLSANLNFAVPKGDPLFGFGAGVLDDLNLFVRIFFESGKRYTPQIFTGFDPLSGKPQYIDNQDQLYGAVGDNWFYVDLNLEKNIDVYFGKLIVAIEVQNLFNNKNSQLINPVTGRAYEYGDPTPTGYNDPLYPTTSGSVQPFPYSPVRYLNPRTVRLSLGYSF